MREFDPLGFAYDATDANVITEHAKRLSREIPSGYGLGGYRKVEAVDLGAWSGQSTIHIARSIPVVHSIDTWEGTDRKPRQNFQTFCRNMGEHLFARIQPHVGRSKTYAEIWPHKVHLVFLDADPRQFRDDVLAWCPHIATDGLLMGAGYGVHKDVTETVDQMKEILPGLVRNAGKSVWWLRCNDTRLDELVSGLVKNAAVAEAVAI